MKSAPNILVFCVCALLSLGMVMLYSSGMTREEGGARLFTMQLIWCGIGLGAGLTMACLDYRRLKKVTWLVYLSAVLLLVLVLVPGIGVEIKGARRWLNLGMFNFQPSEFAKLALILTLAWYGERFQRRMDTFGYGLVVPGLIIGLVLGLIFVEPDRGSTILLGTVCGVVLLIAGVRWMYVVPPTVLAGVGLGYSLWNDSLRMGRINSWLNPEDHKLGAGYQAWQSMIAIGNGGWKGMGLGDSRQKLGFVPEHQTDFIFSIVGEELGLIATLGVLSAFVVLVICGTCIAWRAPDIFGLLLGAGVTFLIGLQALINIGVVTGALPNKGLPLPFISYGGSNLLLMLFCIGLLVSIARAGESDSETVEEPVFRRKPRRQLA